MLKVGLTGGLASGKTHIARELGRLGCHVINADELGHQVLENEARKAVLEEFGTTGRQELAALVFNNPDRLKALTDIVHPAVRRLADLRQAEFQRKDPAGILIYEAAILVETGGFHDFDKLIVASCPEEVQIERGMARDGSTREATLSRLRRQLPLKEKLQYADFVIETSGTREHTLEQTRHVYEKLRGVKQQPS